MADASTRQQHAVSGDRYRPGYEIAAERILEYIVREDLDPGARLPTEKDLAEAVGMSRTIVREAVKILSALGRLSVQVGRGIYVAEPQAAPWREMSAHFLPADPSQVEEIFEFRRVVELSTCQLASQRATPAQVTTIRDTARQSLEFAEAGDLDAFNEADRQFHVAIGAASANSYLAGNVEAVQRLQRQTSVIGLAGTAGGSTVAAAHQHTAIAEAIAAGDSVAAADLMSEHIETTVRQFKAEIQRRLFADDTPD